MRAPGAPHDEAELLARARALAGLSLGEVAAGLGVAIPSSNRSGKGWAGALLELALGASAGSRSMPDFPALGIELKSVPLRADGWPRESTHVCTAPLLPGGAESRFETSCIARKLARVLWFPVQAGPQPPLAERRLGRALLWSPNASELARLRADFEDLLERLHTRGPGSVTARHGEVLQIRPKAANAAQRSPALGADGRRITTNPRGFYLRAAFTAELIGARPRAARRG